MGKKESFPDHFKQNDKLPIRLVAPGFGHLSPEAARNYDHTQRKPYYFFLFMIDGSARHVVDLEPFEVNNSELSEASPESIRKAFAVHPNTALQIEYSLWSRDIENEVLPTIRELGIGLVAYAPLSRGFLSGEFKKPEDIKDSRVHMPRYQSENFYKNLELVEKIKTLAVKKGCTPAQLAIAWVLAQGEDIITIPGSKRIKHLVENIAAEKVQFSNEDLQSLESIMPAGVVSGTRYPEKFLTTLNR